MKLNMKKKLSLAVGICVGLLFILFLAVDPNQVPSSFLILPFLLFFLAILFAILLVMYSYSATSGKKALKVAGLGASAPTLLLVLQSIGQLTVRDFLVILVLFIVSYFYVSKGSPSS